MFRPKPLSILAALLVGAAAWAQEKPAPRAGFDAEACAKHCREMAESRQKAMEGRKAAADRMAAAWKEIRASVDEAKKARGDRKVAALETALDRLVTFHEQMMSARPAMPGMGGMACCAGDEPGSHPMMHGGHGGHGTADCCGGMADMGDCCAGMHGSAGKPDDCPMMKN